MGMWLLARKCQIFFNVAQKVTCLSTDRVPGRAVGSSEHHSLRTKESRHQIVWQQLMCWRDFLQFIAKYCFSCSSKSNTPERVPQEHWIFDWGSKIGIKWIGINRCLLSWLETETVGCDSECARKCRYQIFFQLRQPRLQIPAEFRSV
jgi:hypothetical protein